MVSKINLVELIGKGDKIMKNIISLNDWKELENILMKLRIGYSVRFDDHNGMAEMLIDTNTIAVNRATTLTYTPPTTVEGI